MKLQFFGITLVMIFLLSSISFADSIHGNSIDEIMIKEQIASQETGLMSVFSEKPKTFSIFGTQDLGGQNIHSNYDTTNKAFIGSFAGAWDLVDIGTSVKLGSASFDTREWAGLSDMIVDDVISKAKTQWGIDTIDKKDFWYAYGRVGFEWKINNPSSCSQWDICNKIKDSMSGSVWNNPTSSCRQWGSYNTITTGISDSTAVAMCSKCNFNDNCPSCFWQGSLPVTGCNLKIIDRSGYVVIDDDWKINMLSTIKSKVTKCNVEVNVKDKNGESYKLNGYCTLKDPATPYWGFDAYIDTSSLSVTQLQDLANQPLGGTVTVCTSEGCPTVSAPIIPKVLINNTVGGIYGEQNKPPEETDPEKLLKEYCEEHECDRYCGDNFCDVSLGETEATCPQDCKTETTPPVIISEPIYGTHWYDFIIDFFNMLKNRFLGV